jgi:hypothetical protein
MSRQGSSLIYLSLTDTLRLLLLLKLTLALHNPLDSFTFLVPLSNFSSVPVCKGFLVPADSPGDRPEDSSSFLSSPKCTC